VGKVHRLHGLTQIIEKSPCNPCNRCTLYIIRAYNLSTYIVGAGSKPAQTPKRQDLIPDTKSNLPMIHDFMDRTPANKRVAIRADLESAPRLKGIRGLTGRCHITITDNF